MPHWACSFVKPARTPEHLYYRWRLWSLIQQETAAAASLPVPPPTPFCMIQGGLRWVPPINAPSLPPSTASRTSAVAPSTLPSAFNSNPTVLKKLGQPLSPADRASFTTLIGRLRPSRAVIGEALLFCFDRVDFADDLCTLVVDDLIRKESSPLNKVAQLFLLSDLLHNAAAVTGGHMFRSILEAHLPAVFSSLRALINSLPGRISQQAVKELIVGVIRAWQLNCIYGEELLQVPLSSLIYPSLTTYLRIFTRLSPQLSRPPKPAWHLLPALLRFSQKRRGPRKRGRNKRSWLTRRSERANGVRRKWRRSVGTKCGLSRFACSILSSPPLIQLIFPTERRGPA